MATLREVEDELAALSKRHSDLDDKLARFGVIDHDVGQAMGLVDKQLNELRRRRTALLVGQPDPADAIKAAPSATPSQLRPPRWVTSKEIRATAAEVHEQNVETAKLLPLETTLEDLGELYGTEAHVAVVESELRGYAVEIVENGRACEFNEGMYAALLTMLYRESAARAVTLHWSGNQRRLIEQRVEALESRRQDPLSSIQIQHIEHKLTPLFQVEFANAVAPLIERIGALEQQRDAMKYVGVWEAGREYKLGNFVTDKGSLFHCNSTTRQRPGDGSKDWTLAAKRGADGKDK